MQTSPSNAWPNALPTKDGKPVQDWTQPQIGAGNQWTGTGTSLPAWLGSQEDRQAYLESCLQQDVAWQIRLNREARSMSQDDLAQAIGTRQSSIARAEDTTYGRHSLAMLTKIAHAFDCALLVRFVSYAELLDRISDTSAEALTLRPTHE
jgi:ribosome-binding protein aMBF1 (putative translation factor)